MEKYNADNSKYSESEKGVAIKKKKFQNLSVSHFKPFQARSNILPPLMNLGFVTYIKTFASK